jgi:hypothetical protein
MDERDLSRCKEAIQIVYFLAILRSRQSDVSQVCWTSSRARFFAALRMTLCLAVILSAAKNLASFLGNHQVLQLDIE